EGRNVIGSVVVEIEKLPFEKLGVELISSEAFHASASYPHQMMDGPNQLPTGSSTFYINYIRPASIADRCGALLVGDRVECIDDLPTAEMSLNEAMHRIKSNVSDSIRLQITPVLGPASQPTGSSKKRARPETGNPVYNNIPSQNFNSTFQQNNLPISTESSSSELPLRQIP
ncbi:hypothetical protein Ciccas_007711, partial [Cichlidogyrus casuarinus]